LARYPCKVGRCRVCRVAFVEMEVRCVDGVRKLYMFENKAMHEMLRLWTGAGRLTFPWNDVRQDARIRPGNKCMVAFIHSFNASSEEFLWRGWGDRTKESSAWGLRGERVMYEERLDRC